jgi:hypothetical protein
MGRSGASTALFTRGWSLRIESDDSNLFAYVQGSPTNYSDPRGLEKLTWLSKTDVNYVEAMLQSDPEDAIVINAHGTNARIDRLTPDDLSKRIRGSAKTWEPGRKIVLKSCNAARGENSIAQQLSALLHTTVVGSDRPVWTFVVPLGTWGTIGGSPNDKGPALPN